MQTIADGATPLLVHRPVDPNATHPYRETDIITHPNAEGGLGIVIGDTPLTQFPFRALVYHLKAKEDPRYYWKDKTGAVTRYSNAYVDRIRSLTAEELAAAVKAYRKRNQQQ